MNEGIPQGGSMPLEERYQIAGEGKELFTRRDLRERIRNGDLGPATEIAVEGTDDFRAAEAYPELGRYFSLITGTPATAASSAMVGISPAPATSVAQRLIPALVYPLTGLGSVVVILLAMLEVLPFGGLVTLFLTPLVSLAVIRVSAEGSTRMPSPSAFGGPAEMVLDALKAFALSLLAAWPFILAVILMFVMPRAGASIFIVALVAMLLYYPACLAILARWKTIKPALSVSQIAGFIRILGGDYILALLMMFVVLGVTFAVSLLALTLPSRARDLVIMIPLVWGTFYVFHLIGWAMYRHREEL